MLKTASRGRVVSGWIADINEEKSVAKIRLEFASGIEEVVMPLEKFKLVSGTVDAGECDNLDCHFFQKGNEITIFRIALT